MELNDLKWEHAVLCKYVMPYCNDKILHERNSKRLKEINDRIFVLEAKVRGYMVTKDDVKS